MNYYDWQEDHEESYQADEDRYLMAKKAVRAVVLKYLADLIKWLESARIVTRYITIATSHDVARIRGFAITMLYLVALGSDYDFIGDGFSDLVKLDEQILLVENELKQLVKG